MGCATAVDRIRRRPVRQCAEPGNAAAAIRAVIHPDPGWGADPLAHVPYAVNGRLKTMSKCSVYWLAAPQKNPLVTQPEISVSPITWKCVAVSGASLSDSLNSRFPVPDGEANVNLASPARVLVVSCVSTPPALSW